MVVHLKVRNFYLEIKIKTFSREIDYELDNRENIKETPPNLTQFQNQIDLFQSIYNDIDNWDQTFIFNSWLRVDARPIKRQLLALVTKWINL
jgi:dynein heavy chain